MGQFVSNPTYIRRAILYFYVIFSPLFAASFYTPRYVSPLLPWASELVFTRGEESETEDRKLLFSWRHIGKFIFTFVGRDDERYIST